MSLNNRNCKLMAWLSLDFDQCKWFQLSNFRFLSAKIGLTPVPSPGWQKVQFEQPDFGDIRITPNYRSPIYQEHQWRRQTCNKLIWEPPASSLEAGDFRGLNLCTGKLDLCPQSAFFYHFFILCPDPLSLPRPPPSLPSLLPFYVRKVSGTYWQL